MTRYLWTGESEYCLCGHHLTEDETLQWAMSASPIVICRWSWECEEFRPYRNRRLDEDEEQEEKQGKEPESETET